jgi:hypothetical protein
MRDEVKARIRHLHFTHSRKNVRLERAEKRAVNIIQLSRRGVELNVTQLQHVQRYMDRRKKVEAAETKKALEVKKNE